MQEMGRMLGAQAIVSGSLTEIGGSYRIIIRVLNVQSVVVAVQYRTDITNDRRVQALLGERQAATVAPTSRQDAGSDRRTVVDNNIDEQTFEDMWQYFGHPHIWYWDDNKNKAFSFYRGIFNSENFQAIKTYWDSLPLTFYREIWSPTKENNREVNLMFALELRKDNPHVPAYLNIIITYPDSDGMHEHQQLAYIVPGKVREIIQTMLDLVK
jgi:hypothetical protein